MPYFLTVSQILFLLTKCYLLDISTVTPVQKETGCVYTHFAADYLDLIRELGKRPGSLSAINLQAISHFICLFSAFRTVLLKKACQIPVTFAACVQAACVSSPSMDFQYLFYIFMFFYNYTSLLSLSGIARCQFCSVLIVANDLLM